MDNPEVLERLEDLELSGTDGFVPGRKTISLKEGIDLEELRRGEGTMFEIDTEKIPPAVEDEENDQYFDAEQMFQQLNYECTLDEGDSSSESGDETLTPFKRMARHMEDLSGDGGLLKKVLRPGTGPVVPKGAIVRVHINQYFEYSDEPFDSSRLRNKQEQFTLGSAKYRVHTSPGKTKLQKPGTLLGVTLAVESMRRGEFSRFIAAPDYAYRQMGCPPRVPPNATIMMEIELISWIDSKAADEYGNFTEEERRSATFDQILEAVNSERENGNDAFKRKQYQKAISKYMTGIKWLENVHLKNQDEERQMNSMLLKLYLNVSLCAQELGQSARTISYARKVLNIDSKNTKAMFRLGKAFLRESEFDKARDWLLRAKKQNPSDKVIAATLVELDKKVQRFKMIEKENCVRMFSRQSGSKTTIGKNNKADTKAAGYSDDQRDVMLARLKEFEKNTNLPEMTFPQNLTQQEVACVTDVARTLGLETRFHEGTLKVLKTDTSTAEQSSSR